jgi:hypothetical protein
MRRALQLIIESPYKFILLEISKVLFSIPMTNTEDFLDPILHRLLEYQALHAYLVLQSRIPPDWN